MNRHLVLTCTCGENQAFPPRLVSTILETFLNHVVRSSASCSAKACHWVDHLWPNFLKPPIGSRSDLARFHQFFLCPPWGLFQELIGSTRSIWRDRYSGGFRNTWPNHFKRRSLIVSATSLWILHIRRISALEIQSRNWTLRIFRRQVCSNTFSVFSCCSFNRPCFASVKENAAD